MCIILIKKVPLTVRKAISERFFQRVNHINMLTQSLSLFDHTSLHINNITPQPTQKKTYRGHHQTKI
jgi:hypothetical protein